MTIFSNKLFNFSFLLTVLSHNLNIFPKKITFRVLSAHLTYVPRIWHWRNLTTGSESETLWPSFYHSLGPVTNDVQTCSMISHLRVFLIWIYLYAFKRRAIKYGYNGMLNDNYSLEQISTLLLKWGLWKDLKTEPKRTNVFSDKIIIIFVNNSDLLTS